FVPVGRTGAVAEQPRAHAGGARVGRAGEPGGVGALPFGERQAIVAQAEFADDERARHAPRRLFDGRAAEALLVAGRAALLLGIEVQRGQIDVGRVARRLIAEADELRAVAAHGG